MDKLSKKQERFCQEYVIDLNGTASAIRAGYSEKTAYSIANENLKKPEIKAAIAELQEKIAEKAEVSASRVLIELMRIAFSDITDYTTFGRGKVTIKESKNLTKAQSACIQEISQTTNRGGKTIKFSLYDKLRAIELLGKHIGLFTDKFKLEGQLQTMTDEQLNELYERIITGQRNQN